MSILAALRADDRPHSAWVPQCLNAKPPPGVSRRGHSAAVKVQDSVLRDFSRDSALESGEAEEDYVPVTPRHYLYQEAVSKTGPCRVTLKNDPALVVFRLCFGTSLEHWGQAGCFRLPVKACRPQPPLCVPESFNLRSKFSSRSPRTGQGKFKFKPDKEHDRLPQHPCQYRESSRGRLVKTRREFGGRKGVLARSTGVAWQAGLPPKSLSHCSSSAGIQGPK